MSLAQTILTVLLLAASLALITAVLLQKGDSEGISALTGGGSGGFLGKNKNKTMEGRLALATKVSAVSFVVLAMVLIFV